MTDNGKIKISLYEFYSMGINTLLTKAPWELVGERVSAYHESFMQEQRLLALTMLILLGEEHIPQSVLVTMPAKYRVQVRDSVNQAVFSRALKHHFRQDPRGNAIADQMIRRMESYITISREAENSNNDSLEAITETLARLVPPRSQEQLDLYLKRVEKIFEYTETLVRKSLKSRYEITEM
jgi:hypothetical protein